MRTLLDVSPSSSFRAAADADNRRRRLLTTGRRVAARVVSTRSTGELVGITPTVEIVVELDGDNDLSRRITIVEPLPWGVASSVVAGSEVTVLVDDVDGAAMLDWSR